ncbi:permease-like cell division protein FtsX [Rhizohabitans arisaemae]|uniref:permease-like cell division protein FtsX n=1 Tax=Rhizohabitans arisaemae TaxID=2720610 RepID=UPI0024B05C2D|nr:permease-like cell division protein FtsX [Rhizohabitans arisaemae]
MRANFIFSEVWIGLRRNLTMTIAVIVTVAIGMAMFGVGLMINTQVSAMKGFWDDKVSISVYLCSKNSAFENCRESGAITQAQKDEIRNELQSLPQVAGIEYEDQKQAFEKFKNEQAGNILATVTKAEDLPESFRVRLKDSSQYAAVVGLVKGRPGVANVINQKDILERFYGLLETFLWISVVLASVLVFAAILLIANTMRLAAYNRRRETGIMRLVGASNLYIQMPFLLEGMIAGLIGGLISASMLIMAKVFVFDRVHDYIALTARLTWADVIQVVVVALVAGVIICAVAAFMTLRRYLRV